MKKKCNLHYAQQRRHLCFSAEKQGCCHTSRIKHIFILKNIYALVEAEFWLVALNSFPRSGVLERCDWSVQGQIKGDLSYVASFRAANRNPGTLKKGVVSLARDSSRD